MNSFAELKQASRHLPEQAYVVDRPVDARGQYQFELPPDFPLTVKRLRFTVRGPERPLTWHTYLEVFVLLSKACRVQMGGHAINLLEGDILVMDHLKLHAVRDFPGPTAEAIVIRFDPNIALGLATSASDHVLLLPFYCQTEEAPHVLRAGEAAAGAVHRSLAHLMQCHRLREPAYRQTGLRAYFLEVLHHLACHFQAVGRLKEHFARQQAKTARLGKLFEHIGGNYASRISLPQAAAIAGLSKHQLYAVFKKATGMTFVDYLRHVRLTQAARLLRESDESIAEIAARVGFSDQSYFDRTFRRHFGRTPIRFRKEKT